MRIWPIAREDLRQTLRDKSGIFWIFIAPILWVYFFGAIARAPDPGGARIGLTVVRQDASEAAARFLDQLRAENFALEVVEPGQALPPGREPTRTLTIPADFGEAIAARRKVLLDLEEGESASPEGTFAVQVALHRATIRLLAAEAFGAADQNSDVVTVRSEWAAARKVPSGFYQTIPGNLVMFVLMSTMTGGAALLALERQSGLLRRLASSPLSRREIIMGKLLGRVAIATVQTLVFVIIGLTIFRIDWGSSPAGLAAVMAPFVVCAAALSLLSGAIFSSPGVAVGVGVVLSLVMSALGGCWWPAEVMPGWMRALSYAIPTGWAMNGLHQIISWGGGIGDVLMHAGVLLAFALGAGALAARRLVISA